jgi:hypothetical protein
VPAAPSTVNGTAGPGRPGFLRRMGSEHVMVADRSMEPTLRPGDRLLVDRRAYRDSPPEVGQIVVFPDPQEPRRWLVKRVATVDPVAGTLTLQADAGGTARDSRTFGPVPLPSVRGRAYWLYHPAERERPL